MPKPVDLRSDTITKPTAAMRRCMAEAEVGDDVLRDDPTVIALEERTAEVLGKEAAMYVASGTMANQVALRTHTQPGDEVFLEQYAHIYLYEAGAPAALSGVMCHLIPGVRGVFTGADVRSAVRGPDVHFPHPALLCVENTHNRGGGSVWSLEQIAEATSAAREAGLRTHLDGARLWNATAATGVAEAEYAGHFDSVAVCFSKALGAPVGSALTGSREFIERARRFRKQLGGGMRQAGIIAAGALYALENHRERLAEDHRNAKLLAERLVGVPGLELDMATVETNMVYLDVLCMPARELAERLVALGVLVLALGERMVRAVTSLEVDASDIDRAAAAIGQVLAGAGE